MTTRKIGIDFVGQNLVNSELKYYRGASLNLQVYSLMNLTNYKIRAELFDNCNSIQIATSNSGGSDLQILVTDVSQGIFTLHIDKNLTTCFKYDSVLEIELEDGDGNVLETRRIPVKMLKEKITWVSPDDPTPAPSPTPSVTRYSRTFTNADLTAGILSVTHSLGTKLVSVTVYDNESKQITPEITLIDVNSLIVDLSPWGTITGTWSIIVIL